MKPKYYLFIIDTNSYAGNFEREMCAYITGKTGECEVGHELAEIAEREIPEEIEQFEDVIEWVPGEHGSQIVTIFDNPNHKHEYNSVAIYFCSIPSPKLVKLLKERAQKFAKDRRIKIEGFRFLSLHETYTEINIDG